MELSQVRRTVRLGQSRSRSDLNVTPLTWIVIYYIQSD